MFHILWKKFCASWYSVHLQTFINHKSYANYICEPQIYFFSFKGKLRNPLRSENTYSDEIKKNYVYTGYFVPIA